MRLALSNCVTAAKTSHSSTPARTSTSSSKPTPWMVEPLKLRPRLAKASAERSITHTLLPLSDSMLASCDPTRPHPMTMTLLNLTSFYEKRARDNPSPLSIYPVLPTA